MTENAGPGPRPDTCKDAPLGGVRMWILPHGHEYPCGVTYRECVPHASSQEDWAFGTDDYVGAVLTFPDRGES